MADIFSKLMKSIKPKIHNQFTKGKEKILKEPEKKRDKLPWTEWFTHISTPAIELEDSGMIDICNERTDNLEFYAQSKWQHRDIFI